MVDLFNGHLTRRRGARPLDLRRRQENEPQGQLMQDHDSNVDRWTRRRRRRRRRRRQQQRPSTSTNRWVALAPVPAFGVTFELGQILFVAVQRRIQTGHLLGIVGVEAQSLFVVALRRHVGANNAAKHGCAAAVAGRGRLQVVSGSQVECGHPRSAMANRETVQRPAEVGRANGREADGRTYGRRETERERESESSAHLTRTVARHTLTSNAGPPPTEIGPHSHYHARTAVSAAKVHCCAIKSSTCNYQEPATAARGRAHQPPPPPPPPPALAAAQETRSRFLAGHNPTDGRPATR